MKKYLPLLLVALAVVLTAQRFDLIPDGGDASVGAQATTRDSGSDAIARAFKNQSHDVPVESSGKVVHVLPDDTHGSPHQRFILRLADDQTVLVAHNIDLAPRIDNLSEGDTIIFKGIYEWNDQGGVIHWTHRDPDGRHPGGWLEHDGRRYR